MIRKFTRPSSSERTKYRQDLVRSFLGPQKVVVVQELQVPAVNHQSVNLNRSHRRLLRTGSVRQHHHGHPKIRSQRTTVSKDGVTRPHMIEIES